MNLSGSNLVSGFQLDIQYDINALENLTASKGVSLVSADKDLSTSFPQTGVFRLVAAGVNKNTIPPGKVATISFKIKSDAPLGISQLTLTNLVVTDVNGNSLTTTSNNGSVTVEEGHLPFCSFLGGICLELSLIHI